MYYYHHVPGRLRIKTPAVKGRDRAAAAIREIFDRHEGIHRTTVNTTTGSVVIEYDHHRIATDQVLGILKEHGYFDRAKAQTTDRYMDAKLSRAGESVGKAILTTMIERAFEGSAISLIAALL
ncbi:HMA2 domain-containing protein [Geobacter sp.]|uniref:HMA2 domain-containing protein n=1 Tax=Geobacter sp. TaxID=46610 RepID=UPI002619471F|nr:hypothetical protein [Geobacter sp.]